MSDATPVAPATPREASSQELADQVASGRTAVAEGTVRTVTSRGLDLPPDETTAPAIASAPDNR
ncbi:hypothetical protein [Streptomyces sp. NPDC052015]|uniref:hypothetical protein n=1 Tax=Streptomyces sp. NPDC052015 TaxID=3154755 RepID=UPI00343F4059